MTSPRSTTGLFAFTGFMFVLYPVLRPYSSETGVEGADAFASPLWVASHVCAMLGFIALALAVRAVADTASAIVWIGVGLVLPYYGAETFALHALGADARDTGDLTLIELSEPIRYGPVAMTMFGVGLASIAVGAVMVARRLGGRQVWVFAVGFVLFLPQFYAPPILRVAHGLLILAGCLLVARRVYPVSQEISTTTGA